MNNKKRVFIVVGSIAITPLVLALLCRYYLFNINAPLPLGITSADYPVYSYMTLTPNYRGDLVFFNVFRGVSKIKHTTTEYGLRVPVTDYSKPLVLFSGDSTLFGLGLNDYDTVPFKVGEKLHESYGIINAGIPGKNLAHNLITLKFFIKEATKKGTKIKYFINWVNYKDFEVVNKNSIKGIERTFIHKKYTKKERFGKKYPTCYFLFTSLKNPTNVNNYIRYSLKQIFNYPIVAEKRDISIHPIVNPTECSFKILSQMEKICKENNIIMFTIITPYSQEDIYSDYGKSDALKKTLIEHKFKNIYLVKNFYRSSKIVYSKLARHNEDYVHYSKNAAGLIANHLTKLLQRKN